MRLAIASAVLSLGAAAAAADDINYVWSAEVSGIDFQMGTNLDIGLTVGDGITGTLSFPDDVTDTFAAADPDRYSPREIPLALSFTANGVTFSFFSAENPSGGSLGYGRMDVDSSRDTAPTGSLLGIDLRDNDANEDLAADPAIPEILPISRNGVELTDAFAETTLQISDSTPGLFEPGVVLNESLDLDEFDVAFINITLSEVPNGSNLLSFQANFTSFRLEGDPLPPDLPDDTVVPLPQTGLLALSGIAMLALASAGRRRRSL